MSTTSSWPLLPETREIRPDEMWSSVAKKRASCDPDDPADDHEGDRWDFVAHDAEHRPVVAVVPGARSIENAEEVAREAHDRAGGRQDVPPTSDEPPAYGTAIGHACGVPEEPKPAATPGRPPIEPTPRAPANLEHATVHNGREEGRVAAIPTAVAPGTWAAVAGALWSVGARAGRSTCHAWSVTP